MAGEVLLVADLVSGASARAVTCELECGGDYVGAPCKLRRVARSLEETLAAKLRAEVPSQTSQSRSLFPTRYYFPKTCVEKNTHTPSKKETERKVSSASLLSRAQPEGEAELAFGDAAALGEARRTHDRRRCRILAGFLECVSETSLFRARGLYRVCVLKKATCHLRERV